MFSCKYFLKIERFQNIRTLVIQLKNSRKKVEKKGQPTEKKTEKKGRPTEMFEFSSVRVMEIFLARKGVEGSRDRVKSST